MHRPEDNAYRLGILIDTAVYYEQSDILERDVMRPKLLANFGWNVCQVFAKYWYQTPDRVVHRVLQLVAGEADHESDESEVRTHEVPQDDVPTEYQNEVQRRYRRH